MAFARAIRSPAAAATNRTSDGFEAAPSAGLYRERRARLVSAPAIVPLVPEPCLRPGPRRPSRGASMGSGPLPAAGRAAGLRLSGQDDPAVGRDDGRRDRPSQGACGWVQPFARCRTGGSPRAHGTRRSGCGIWRRGAEIARLRGIRIELTPFACCRTGGSPRALRTRRSGCGM